MVGVKEVLGEEIKELPPLRQPVYFRRVWGWVSLMEKALKSENDITSVGEKICSTYIRLIAMVYQQLNNGLKLHLKNRLKESLF